MLHISPSTRILVCLQLIDFRKGIDGLAAVCSWIQDIFKPSYRTATLTSLSFQNLGEKFL